MLPLLIALALIVPRGPLDPPGECLADTDDAPSLAMAAGSLNGWRLWASEPAWTTTLDELGGPLMVTISLTQTVTLPPGQTFTNAFAEMPGQSFTFYACAPGDLPPGGGWRIFSPDVRG